jgi:hypothetical protein
MYADQATAFASSNRDAHAEQLLTTAVREAVAAYRVALALERRYPDMGATVGVADAVEQQLLSAGRSAENILGPRLLTAVVSS